MGEQTICDEKGLPSDCGSGVWTDTWLKRNRKWQIAAAQDNKVDCK
jgi:hypothetical protein